MLKASYWLLSAHEWFSSLFTKKREQCKSPRYLWHLPKTFSPSPHLFVLFLAMTWPQINSALHLCGLLLVLCLIYVSAFQFPWNIGLACTPTSCQSIWLPVSSQLTSGLLSPHPCCRCPGQPSVWVKSIQKCTKVGWNHWGKSFVKSCRNFARWLLNIVTATT